jgi:SAM-dependent methyltransferase
LANFDEYAAYYDLLYRDKDYVGEAGFIRQLLARYAPGADSLLELGCGTGIHAQYLAEAGLAVHGVDLSPSMVERARQRLQAVGASDRLSFSVGDVRAVRLDRNFGAAISLFHVMSYQTTNADVLATLGSAASHLEPGGVFIFDFWFGPAVLTQKPEVRVKRMQSSTHRIVRIAEPELDAAACRCDVNYTVFVTEVADDTTRSIQETHRMRYFFLPELQLLVEQAGLTLEASFEWMTMHQPGTDTWGVCAVARK